MQEPQCFFRVKSLLKTMKVNDAIFVIIVRYSANLCIFYFKQLRKMKK